MPDITNQPSIQPDSIPAESLPLSRVTVVCCVEAGALEAMTVRMVASLRQFGGALSSAHVVAVTPRRGLPLSDETHNAFRRLDVEHLAFHAQETYAWNNFMNKPHALLAVDQRGDGRGDIICWLDSDILVTGPPLRLALRDAEFAACAPDKNVGTTGQDDENDPFWHRVFAVLDMDPVTLPWVTTCVEQARIRWYFNSGVFAFRQKSGFAQAFLDDCRRLLDARFASLNSGIFFTDQIAMGLTAHRLGLSFDILPHAYNLALGSKGTQPTAEQLKQALVLHYHDAMWPAQWPSTLSLLASHRPDVHDFLKPMGPLALNRPLPVRIAMKGLKLWREHKLSQHLALCRFV
jgi:hypothetical protein